MEENVTRENVEYCPNCGLIDWFGEICPGCGHDKSVRSVKLVEEPTPLDVENYFRAKDKEPDDDPYANPRDYSHLNDY